MMNGGRSVWASSGQCARVYTPRSLMSFYYKSPRNLRLLLIASVTAEMRPTNIVEEDCDPKKAEVTNASLLGFPKVHRLPHVTILLICTKDREKFIFL